MIRARVLDAAALAARTPAELSTYLRATGWHLAERKGTVARWTMPVDDDEFEVLQPLDPTKRDYAARIADAVEVLAIVVEGRSELEILRQISDASTDVHTIRLLPADQPSGMIGLDDGVTAFESVRALVAAAAYTVFAARPRAVQPSRKPQGLTDFLNSVRVGPSTEGSYTLSVFTPVPPKLSTEQLTFDDELGVPVPEPEPIERQVSLRVYQAVQAAQAAADAALLTAEGLDQFTNAVDRGVSANLCEALVGLGSGRHPFEVSLTLAAARPGASPLAPIRFRRDHLPVLREAAEELRARTPEEDVAITGNVIRLHRESPETGEITLVGRVEDQEVLRRIWMDLPSAEYELAMRAHREMLLVSVRGNLVRRGTRLYLARPTGFDVLSDSESGLELS